MGIDLSRVKNFEDLLDVLGEGDWEITLPNGYPDLVVTAAWREELSKIASHQFVRWVLGGVTYEIRHDDDPPWDQSGEAHRVMEDPQQLLTRYDTLGDWLENEYTGNKQPTYDSHCGWNWDTYKHDLEETLGENLFELILTHLRQTRPEIDPVSTDICDEIGWQDIFLEYAIMDSISRVKTAEAWQAYETEVLKLLREERLALAARAAEYTRLSQLARQFRQQHFPDLDAREKIEMPMFNERNLETRLEEALADADPEVVNAIATVGLPIVCSNSVEAVIKHIAQHSMCDCQHIEDLYDL